MGAYCPKCKMYKPITRNLTVDQLPARKAVDVLGHILGCGHKYGNDEFMKIQDAVNEAKAAFNKESLALEKEHQKKLNGILGNMTKMKVGN